MNIVIVAGGTGSIALQNGLYSFFEKHVEGVNIKVLVNAYDNGLSTGMVRKVLGGRILGPSDVRKNQTTRFKLENPTSPYHEFLDDRFTAAPTAARGYCMKKVEQLREKLLESLSSSDAPFNLDEIKILKDTALISTAINKFFSYSAANQIDYNDFSLANIVYAGLAALNGYSLRAAAKVMADVLGIKDNVILNDDTSLFLGAVTKSGKRITDEGDIVSWNNPDDPIVDLFYLDEHGMESKPVLCAEAREALHDADYIILSSGTQWSSLIPTYDSLRWKDTISSTKARVLMVMNRVPDKDAPGQSASDIIKTLVPRFFPTGQLEVVVDKNGHELMNHVRQDVEKLIKHVDYFDIEMLNGPATKHNPLKLAHAIGCVIHRDVIGADAYIFDYDDTLVGRGNSHPASSSLNTHCVAAMNMSGFKVYICSGNSIKAIRIADQTHFGSIIPVELKPITVFADGGINEYEYTPSSSLEEPESICAKLKGCLDVRARFGEQTGTAESIIQALRSAGIPASKIENRGDVMISVKPIDPEYREAIRTLISMLLGDKYCVKSAGRTTVEINLPHLSKVPAVEKVLNTVTGTKKVVYIGDEHRGGNDAPIYDLALNSERLVFWPVKSPTDTAFLLRTICGFSLQ